MNPPSILVAEDDANDTLLFKRAFSKAAIQVPIIFLRDGEEVIDYLSGQAPFEDRLANPWPALIWCPGGERSQKYASRARSGSE